MSAWFPKPETKVCTRCKVEKKRAADFPIDKRRRDLVGPWCYDCLKIWFADYRKNNRAKENARMYRWRASQVD